jgi:lipid A 4'-phosphatase
MGTTEAWTVISQCVRSRMMDRAVTKLAFLVCSAGLAAFFVTLPAADLWFSALFYDEGRGFYLNDALWVQFLYRLVPVLTVVVSLALLGLLSWTLIKKQAVGPFNTRAVLYLLAALALGPGLVVHGVFKEHWGRARPRDIIEFGGDRRFTPAFVISDQCQHNCSFVAGHPSVPFYLVAFALVARRRRYAILASAIGLGAAVGLGRIVQGAHFLSDVIFSGIFVFLVAYLLFHYVFRLGAAQAVGATTQ